MYKYLIFSKKLLRHKKITYDFLYNMNLDKTFSNSRLIIYENSKMTLSEDKALIRATIYNGDDLQLSDKITNYFRGEKYGYSKR